MKPLIFLLLITTFSLFGNETIMNQQQEELPSYLYKILSLKDWQASQNRGAVQIYAPEDKEFIHFSKEDQLERILTKYWSKAPQFVVLKVETSKLKGELKYETNPGGAAKYYHLYNGAIPFCSIAESKTLYKEHSEPCKLSLVQSGDPILRTPARPLSKEEILSPEIQTLIYDMKAVMRAAPGVGVAAPQIGKSIQLIVIEDECHSFLTPEQLAERERSSVPFHVIINPKLSIVGTEKAEFFEGCLSIPGYIGIVPRAKSVRVECLNERAEPVVIHAKGWYARILQHEIDHLRATLYLDRAYLATVMTADNFVTEWKEKPIPEVLKALCSHTNDRSHRDILK